MEQTANRPIAANPGIAFLVRAVFWVVVLFTLVRIDWVEQNLLLPFATFQGRVACALAGTPPNSVFVGLSCTGADPMALVVGAVLAFPVAWAKRIAGCALGLALIIALNTARIGTLSMVVAQRDLFNLLHIYIWPALLIVAAAGYVFTWMGRSLRAPEKTAATGRSEISPIALSSFSRRSTLQFLGLMCLFVLIFFLGYQTWMSSSLVLEVARWATGLAGLVLTAFGVPIKIDSNMLRTATASYVVTQACVVTPLLPVYLAAAMVLPRTVGRRIVAVLAAFPIFLLLGSVRLLVLALPRAMVGSHLTAIHAFYQTLAAVAVVAWLTLRRKQREALWDKASALALSLAAGAVSAFAVGLLGRFWLWPAAERLRESAHLGHAWMDSQGALSLLPPFQIGLWVALWIALRMPFRGQGFLAGLGALVVFQGLLIMGFGEFAHHTRYLVPVTLIRLITLVVPIGLALWMRRRPATPRPAATSDSDCGVPNNPAGFSVVE